MRAELLLDCRNTHGEGIFWSSQHGLLYWTDIHGECVWTYQPQVGRAEKFEVPGRVCCFADRKGRPPNEVVAAFADGFALLDLSSGERRDIAAFEPDLPTTRLNDGRTDRQGRFIAGGMDEDGAADFVRLAARSGPDLDAALWRCGLRQRHLLLAGWPHHVVCR